MRRRTIGIRNLGVERRKWGGGIRVCSRIENEGVGLQGSWLGVISCDVHCRGGRDDAEESGEDGGGGESELHLERARGFITSEGMCVKLEWR